VVMKQFGGHMLYAFVCGAGVILVLLIRPKAVTHLHQVENAPLHHVAMPDSMSSSPLVVALDPRVDEQVVQEQMQATVEPEPESEPEAVSEAEVDAESEVLAQTEPAAGAEPAEADGHERERESETWKA